MSRTDFSISLTGQLTTKYWEKVMNEKLCASCNYQRSRLEEFFLNIGLELSNFMRSHWLDILVECQSFVFFLDITILYFNSQKCHKET